MSELKRHHINEVMDMHNLTRGKMGYSFVYYADDADRVIKDLIEKNRRLANKDIIMASEAIKEVYKELRHHKYKRCLAMANSCSDKASAEYAASYVSCDEYYYHHAEFWEKWEKRWLELADKFKEAK